MKNITKKLLFMLVIFVIIISISSEAFAWSEVIQKGKDFVSAGENPGEDVPIDPEKVNEGLQGLSSYLYNLLLTAGVVIAVIVATILGIQFMMGGAEGQAKVKEMLVPFIVGCIVVFGGFGIWKIAITVGEQLESIEPPKVDVSNTVTGIGNGIHTGGTTR